MTLVVRADGPASGIIAPVAERIEVLAVEFPIGITTLHMRAEQALANERALTTVSGTIAAMSLILAGIGIFSLASCAVRDERRGIGVRIAIGADRRKVPAWALARLVCVPLAGVGAGLPVAVLIGRPLKSVLFGVPSTAPWALAGARTVLVVISLLATLQACFVEPMGVLLEEYPP